MLEVGFIGVCSSRRLLADCSEPMRGVTGWLMSSRHHATRGELRCRRGRGGLPRVRGLFCEGRRCRGWTSRRLCSLLVPDALSRHQSVAGGGRREDEPTVPLPVGAAGQKLLQCFRRKWSMLLWLREGFGSAAGRTEQRHGGLQRLTVPPSLTQKAWLACPNRVVKKRTFYMARRRPCAQRPWNPIGDPAQCQMKKHLPSQGRPETKQ